MSTTRRRAPYGARGLKFVQMNIPGSIGEKSRPVWGAWIEIRQTPCTHIRAEVAPRMGRVD